MPRNTFLVLGIGLLLILGLPLSIGAADIGLARQGVTLTSLDSPGNVGQFTAVAIGTDGLGLISYYDATSGSLKVANYSNFARVPTAAQPLSITGSLHSKQRTDRLSVNKKKNGTTAERERAQNRSF